MQKITQILLAGIFVSVFSIVNAQNLSIPNGQFYISGPDTLDRLEAHLEVENSGHDAVSVLINCDRSLMMNGHQSYYCWALCYDTSVCASPDPLTVAGQSTDVNSFHSYVYTNGLAGQSILTYTFFDQNNPSDNTVATIVFDVLSTTGIADVPKPNLSVAQPNPANSFTNINYSLPSMKDGKIIITDVIGKPVKVINLSNSASIELISTAELNSGVYLYSLVNNGKTVLTKKLIVAHH